MGILGYQLEIISLLLGVDHRKIKCILISSDSYIGYCDTFALIILHGQAAFSVFICGGLVCRHISSSHLESMTIGMTSMTIFHCQWIESQKCHFLPLSFQQLESIK